MTWYEVQGRWKHYKGKLQEKWRKLTDDDLNVINGRRQTLVGKIQELYCTTKGVTERQLDQFAPAPGGKRRERGRLVTSSSKFGATA